MFDASEKIRSVKTQSCLLFRSHFTPPGRGAALRPIRPSDNDACGVQEGRATLGRNSVQDADSVASRIDENTIVATTVIADPLSTSVAASSSSSLQYLSHAIGPLGRVLAARAATRERTTTRCRHDFKLRRSGVNRIDLQLFRTIILLERFCV